MILFSSKIVLLVISTRQGCLSIQLTSWQRRFYVQQVTRQLHRLSSNSRQLHVSTNHKIMFRTKNNIRRRWSVKPSVDMVVWKMLPLRWFQYALWLMTENKLMLTCVMSHAGGLQAARLNLATVHLVASFCLASSHEPSLNEIAMEIPNLTISSGFSVPLSPLTFNVQHVNDHDRLRSIMRARRSKILSLYVSIFINFDT